LKRKNGGLRLCPTALSDYDFKSNQTNSMIVRGGLCFHKEAIMNRHHILPQSRDRRKDKDTRNIVMWDESFHDRWHRLFENMTVTEIYEFIAVVTEPGTSWDYDAIRALKRQIKGES
jgi:hypothetical protein